MSDTLTRPSRTPARDLGRARPGPVPPSLATEVLEVLLELDGQGAAIDRSDLQARLPVPGWHVDETVARLVADGAVEVTDDRVRLRPEGRERATTAVRRHRLVERMLADLVGLDWWKVHHEAERFEGVISADVEAKLIEQLGDPGTCPHGNPIPGSRNAPEHPDAVLLADAPVGPVHVVRITETLEGDDEALQLLQNCGFLPGRDAEVKDRRDGWVEVAGTVHDAAFPHHIAAHTYVAPR